MASPLTYLLIGIAAVLAYNGVGHLRTLASGKRDPLTAVFGVACLLGGLYAVACLHTYHATRLEDLVFAARGGVLLLRLVTIILPWFLALYADIRAPRFLLGLSAVLAAHAIANTLLPSTFLYEAVTVTFHETPWGERIAALSGPLSWRAYLLYAVDLLLIVYLAVAARRLWWRGERNRAWPLLMLSAFACVAFANDTLLDAGRIRSIYLEEYVVLALLFIIDGWLGSRRMQAEVNYRNMFDAVAEAISVHDGKTGHIIDLNESAAALFRTSRSDLLSGDPGRTIAGTPPYTLAGTAARIQQAASEPPQTFDWLCRHVHDGSLFWSEVAIRTALIDGRRVVLVSHRDVTARRQADEALRESESRYRAIVAAFDGLLFINAQDGTLEFMNDRLIAVVGRDATGEPWPTVLADFGELCADDATPRVCAGETVGQTVHTSDGHWYDVINVAIRHADGSVSRQAMMSDVTTQRLAEAERRALDDKMKQMQKIETLGLLAGSVAHDFNNLLTAVLGNAEVGLKEIGPDGPGRGAMEDIRTIACRAGELCRQLLATSRQRPLVRQATVLPEIVEETARFVEVSLAPGIRIARTCEPDTPVVRGDPTQLRQIVLNLITNASEALGQAGGVIDLRVRPRTLGTEELTDFVADCALPAGRYAEIMVRDGGRGMDEATRSRLFEPFFSTKQSGRGLGMPAVLGIVRAHQGAIRIDSQPSLGTTVSILLPAAPAGTRPPAESKPVAAPPRRRTGTVLVVDDNARVLQAVSRLIESLGYSVKAAGGGREALELYRAAPGAIDCVLLDVMMPEMDGWETLEHLHAIDPTAVVILSSGYAERGTRRNVSGEHPLLFLQKPYAETDLCAILDQALRLREPTPPG